MAKLLVVDQQRSARRGLKDDLGKLGYEVQEASTTEAGLEMALKGGYDGILLDVQMAIKDDWKVLHELKGNPRTKGTPVMMLTAVRSNKDEATGLRLGASHFISKPWHPEGLALTVRVALREAQERARNEPPDVSLNNGYAADNVYPVEVAPVPAHTSNKTAFGTGGKLVKLEGVLGGGLSIESLTFIVGNPGTGKSVLCQYLIYAAIVAGRNVTFLSTDHNADTLADQMRSIDLDTSNYLREGQLDIRPLERPSSEDDPADVMAQLAREIQYIPPEFGFVIVDSISGLAQISQSRSVLSFFARCQDSCTDGKTVVIVARDSAFDPLLLPRLAGVCDTHIIFGSKAMGAKVVHTLEVQKLNNVQLKRDNGFGFEVVPQVGIHVVPLASARA